jgi:hypothetical protein
MSAIGGGGESQGRRVGVGICQIRRIG